MKSKTLTKQASLCKTDKAAQALLTRLKEAFCETASLKPLRTANEEAFMEGENETLSAYVRFEFNRVISDNYITMIRPEIRNGELSVLVVTQQMLDGKGMASQSWRIINDMEEVIASDDDSSINSLANEARDVAMSHHAALLTELAVPAKQAELTARKCWPKVTN